MAHGKTREQAIREIGVACDLWIETASEMGIDIPEPALYSTAKYQIQNQREATEVD